MLNSIAARPVEQARLQPQAAELARHYRRIAEAGPEQRVELRPQPAVHPASHSASNTQLTGVLVRESLTEGMAFRAFKCRKERSPREGELDRFMEELITSAYQCGYDTWDDDFLYSE